MTAPPDPAASSSAEGTGQITLIAVYDSDSCADRCGIECYDAAGPGCACICGGMNHGAGRQQAISNTLKYAYQWLDSAIMANPSILAADIMTGPGQGISGTPRRAPEPEIA